MPYREQIPIDKGIDNTLPMMMEGYLYITNRRNRYERDMFETRILGGQKAVCIAGREAAEIFYDESKFMRKGAAPNRVKQTLFGEKSIQTMDDERHKDRKEMLLSLMTEEHIQEIIAIFKTEWEMAIDTWLMKEEIILYQEMIRILSITICKWSGIPLSDSDAHEKAKQLEALFQSAGAVGPRHWKGRQARNALEQWLEQIIETVRKKSETTKENTALSQIALYREPNGSLLDSKVAAVELLNILRPTVAVAVYIVFTALALHENTEARESLQREEISAEMFIQEVRRFYPFFPYAVARVRDDFLWNGHDFKKGNLVLLDLYGNNHHPKIWEKPNQFYPEHFRNRKEDPFDFIPQGGGFYKKGHRCPGEMLTVEMMKTSLDMFMYRIEYEVPKQDLQYSMIRMPSLPKSRFRMSHIKNK